jgi:hypothetical protein
MKFERANFFYANGFLTYNGMFIARFKYNTQDRAPFIAFLCKNFTVEEYCELQGNGMSPLAILRSKGYISPSMKRAMKLK